jgi:hypothetical protein
MKLTEQKLRQAIKQYIGKLITEQEEEMKLKMKVWTRNA